MQLNNYTQINNEFITNMSNYTYKQWVENMAKLNVMNATRIDSRVSGNIDCIELTGNDRRKIK